jgi:hypothetical protein
MVLVVTTPVLYFEDLGSSPNVATSYAGSSFVQLSVVALDRCRIDTFMLVMATFLRVHYNS